MCSGDMFYGKDVEKKLIGRNSVVDVKASVPGQDLCMPIVLISLGVE